MTWRARRQPARRHRGRTGPVRHLVRPPSTIDRVNGPDPSAHETPGSAGLPCAVEPLGVGSPVPRPINSRTVHGSRTRRNSSARSRPRPHPWPFDGHARALRPSLARSTASGRVLFQVTSAPVSTTSGAAPGEVAETVLSRDPLRAEWIAQNYLDDVSCYTRTRNMLGFTGSFRGGRISVQGTGMGQPSLGIYVHELVTEFGARTLIRVGSCGGLIAEVALRDVVIAMSACTDSSMNQLRSRHRLCADRRLRGVESGRRGAERAGVRSSRSSAAWDSSTATDPNCSNASPRTACWLSRWRPLRSTLWRQARVRALTVSP